ncbi:META domain-containing protein [Acinetobacter sp.]|jgi:heat shock protein HslJ|uniref:META domain-containing protein n=1 Tax=Acinetobacter sp. TaxID=472 RepID=UPI0035B2B235
MLKKLLLAAALGSAVIISGCESVQTVQRVSDNLQLLQNKTWIATQIGNTEIQTSPSSRNIPSIQFDEATKRVSGSDGCNRLTGAYAAGNDTLNMSQLASTRMACLNNGDLAQKYNEALSKVTHYQVFGKTLKLMDRHGNLLIQYESAVQPR